MSEVPLLIEFIADTKIHRDPEVVPKLPIVQNGPPGTSVIFSDGATVPLPTDQIVFEDDTAGRARVGFGGMSFEGIEDGSLVFYRIRRWYLQSTSTLARCGRLADGPPFGARCRRHVVQRDRTGKVAISPLRETSTHAKGSSRRLAETEAAAP
jgi:hypothetical protein